MSAGSKKPTLDDKLPPGAVAGEWFISSEGSKWFVKRNVTKADGSRSFQRLPARDYDKYRKAYSDVELSQQLPGEELKPPLALTNFVTRLNGKDPKAERVKALVKYSHAFINDEFLQNYRISELYSAVSDRSNADTLFNYLIRYGLHWFLTVRSMHSPLEWKAAEKEWGRYLMNRPVDRPDMVESHRLFVDSDPVDELRTPSDRQLSAKVLKYTVFEMNRFLRYVYKMRRKEFPDEMPQLEPWGPDLLKSYSAEWRLSNPPRLTKYIKDAHWKIISETLKARDVIWRHEVHLAHDYGLRRRETMGLNELSVRQTYLHLLQQLKKFEYKDGVQVRIFSGLKGREPERQIPNWFSEAKVTRSRIRAMTSQPLPHPDTVSSGFSALMKTLTDENGNPMPHYIFHDLRRTFITNAVKKGIPVEELRLATGHKDPQVLIKFYLMDARELESDFDLGEDDEVIDV